MSNSHIVAFTAKKILLPIDFSQSSEAAFEAAAGLAQQFHAGIHLVHIIPEIPDLKGADFFQETAVLHKRDDAIEEKLEARKEQLVLKGVATSFSVEKGNDIVGSLMRVIKREKADLLVLSTHGLSGWRPLIWGSIAEQVIKQVNCTLLLLQSGQHRSIAKEPAIEVWENTFVPQVGSAVPQPETLSQQRLDRVADDMAERGEKTEQNYDQAHSLFTK